MNKIILIWTIVSIQAYGQNKYFITSADQTKIYIEELGTGESVIVLAGGPGLNPAYLKPVWENLSSTYRSIILHQRGTGRSIISTVDSSSMLMQNYVNDLEALRKHLKLEKITLIGHSWGGMLAMEYISHHPNNVKNLILLSSGGPTKKFESYFSDNLEMRLTEDDRKERAELDSLNKPGIKAIWPGYFFDRRMAIINKATVDFDSIYGQQGVGKFTMTSYHSNENHRVKHLKEYKGRASIIQGRQDPIGESTVYEIKELIPQAQINFINKCGHLTWLENTRQKDSFYELLYRSLERE